MFFPLCGMRRVKRHSSDSQASNSSPPGTVLTEQLISMVDFIFSDFIFLDNRLLSLGNCYWFRDSVGKNPCTVGPLHSQVFFSCWSVFECITQSQNLSSAFPSHSPPWVQGLHPPWLHCLEQFSVWWVLPNTFNSPFHCWGQKSGWPLALSELKAPSCLVLMHLFYSYIPLLPKRNPVTLHAIQVAFVSPYILLEWSDMSYVFLLFICKTVLLS